MISAGRQSRGGQGQIGRRHAAGTERDHGRVAGGRSSGCSRRRPTDLLERCRNADVYAEPDPNVTPFAPWPDPPAGHGIRVYPLADIPKDSGRFGRMLRCSTIMVNYFYPDDEPRDPHKLSPHHHDDFEQISLQLEGDYVHHIRTPWTVELGRRGATTSTSGAAAPR